MGETELGMKEAYITRALCVRNNSRVPRAKMLGDGCFSLYSETSGRYSSRSMNSHVAGDSRLALLLITGRITLRTLPTVNERSARCKRVDHGMLN